MNDQLFGTMIIHFYSCNRLQFIKFMGSFYRNRLHFFLIHIIFDKILKIIVKEIIK